MAVLSRQPYRLLSGVGILPLGQAVLPVGAHLRLERGALLVWEHLPALLALKRATANLTRLDVLGVQSSRTLAEQVVLLVNELSASRLDLAELLVPAGLGGWANGSMRVAVVPALVEEGLTDILESSRIVGALVLPAHHIF